MRKDSRECPTESDVYGVEPQLCTRGKCFTNFANRDDKAPPQTHVLREELVFGEEQVSGFRQPPLMRRTTPAPAGRRPLPMAALQKYSHMGLIGVNSRQEERDAAQDTDEDEEA